jgi:hypothetical protein
MSWEADPLESVESSLGRIEVLLQKIVELLEELRDRKPECQK